MRKFTTEPLPYYCTIGETGTDVDTGGAGGPPPGGEGGETGGEDTGERGSARQSLRQQLEKGFEDDRRADQGKGRNDKGQFTRGRRNAGGADLDTQEAGGDQENKTGDQSDNQGQQQTAAPEAFAKEAKAEWANVPPTVQAAILKREQDMAKGVEELKGKYTELDKALQPHMEAIRKHGHTPAQAVGQLFAWFQALAANPTVAFPALAKSFNFDLGALNAPQQQQQQEAGKDQGQQQAQQGDIPEPVKQYIANLEKKLGEMLNPITQKIGTLETTFQKTNEEKTNEILMAWAKDKPYFEEVRQHMGRLIGSGAVPPKEDGKIDLDKAYDMAIFAVPEVRAKVLAAQQEEQRKAAAAKAEAERKAQAEAAAKARGAGISVNSGAPGAPGTGQQRQRPQRKSVRETLKEAIEQVREG